MSDEDEKPADGEEQRTPLEEYAAWKAGLRGTSEPPRERFRKLSHISVYMTYDLIDKLRWYEKQVLDRPDEEIAGRVPHMIGFLDRLTAAYLEFTDVDI
jgi:hypothetical protein